MFVSTKLFVFMINYDFESRINFDFSADVSESIRERILIRENSNIIDKMKDIWEFIKQKLINAQQNQKHYADRKRNASFKYVVEDEMWLFIKNMKTKRSSRKLNHKWIESYKIKKILKNACQLNLSQSMKIHDIFHISLLRKIAINFLIEQIQSSSSSIIIKKDDEEKFEINDILNSKYHYEKLQYKVV
jgi:hypothetical protein